MRSLKNVISIGAEALLFCCALYGLYMFIWLLGLIFGVR